MMLDATIGAAIRDELTVTRILIRDGIYFFSCRH